MESIVLDIDNTSPDGDRFRLLCTEVVKGDGRDTGLSPDGRTFRMPEAWIQALKELLESYPGLRLSEGRFCLWQVVIFSGVQWHDAGLRNAAVRPLRYALLDAGLDVEVIIYPRLLAALHKASL